MPSTTMVPASGGIPLVESGLAQTFSGGPYRVVGGLQLRYDVSGPGVIYVRLPNHSGLVVTGGSGVSGAVDFLDGMPLGRGDSYFIPNLRLYSGLETPRISVPAAASGGHLFWELM